MTANLLLSVRLKDKSTGLLQLGSDLFWLSFLLVIVLHTGLSEVTAESWEHGNE